MLHRLTKRHIAILLLTFASVLGVTGVAFGYFTSSGSGNGQASVGSASPFTVSVSSDSSGSLYPGAGSETLTYTVTNPSSGYQHLAGTSAAVVAYSGSISADAGDVTQSGNPVSGCLASWFSAANTAPSSQELAGGATSPQGNVVVTMSDSGTNQDPCQGARPDITVSAN